MAMSEKEVFFTLLKNHKTNLLTLCGNTGLPYSKISKRLSRNSLYSLPVEDLQTICAGLQVSYESLYALLIRAKDGGFPDDYPREKLFLQPDVEDIRDRKIIMLVTPEEKEIIEIHRREVRKAVLKAIEHPKSSGLQ